MIAEFVKRCRVPGAHKTVWLPIAMLGIGLAYTILYALDSDIFGFIEMTAALCFTVVAIWESSIKTGLVQSNTHYDEMLKYSGLGVAVADNDYTVYYRSDDALSLTAEQMKETENGYVMLDGGIRLSDSEIRGGHTLWQEDLSELLDILTITNNGKRPDGPIVEGGGLSTLRRRVERAGGTMVVQSLPIFKLTVTVPREKEGVL